MLEWKFSFITSVMVQLLKVFGGDNPISLTSFMTVKVMTFCACVQVTIESVKYMSSVYILTRPFYY